MKKTNLLQKIVEEILPLLILPVFFLITKNEILFSIILFALLFAVFKVKYFKNEWLLFFVGTLFGLLFEIGGDLIYKIQYWNGDFIIGKIPLWLPLMWGFGFIFINRLGNLVVKRQ